MSPLFISVMATKKLLEEAMPCFFSKWHTAISGLVLWESASWLSGRGAFLRTEGQGVEHIGAAKARLAIDFLLCYQATEISPTIEKDKPPPLQREICWKEIEWALNFTYPLQTRMVCWGRIKVRLSMQEQADGAAAAGDFSCVCVFFF